VKNEDGNETIPCMFKFKQDYDLPEIKSVEIVLGHSAGVNNDLFEIYTNGVSVSENSPLLVCPLEQDDQSYPKEFKVELQLIKRTYQFLFKTEDVEGKKSFAVSDDYAQTKLVSGRIVNYFDVEETVVPQKQAFEDINESSHLLDRGRSKEAAKKNRICGCGPHRCSVL